MTLLLDTCALLALADGELPRPSAVALRRAPDVLVSAVSPWEVGIKVAAGKLRLNQTPAEWFRRLVERFDLREVALDARIACAAAALPWSHGDPFDRVIVALAQAHAWTVVTSDTNMRAFPDLKTLW